MFRRCVVDPPSMFRKIQRQYFPQMSRRLRTHRSLASAFLVRIAYVPRACAKITSDPSGRPRGALFFNGFRAMYQSDITQFLNQLKEQKPQLEDEQRRGRALLWDKQPIDLDERSEQQAARVKQTSYVYYQNF
jgi:7,8-dihydro-6-hydroxymethylpterin-pyrophosphokinase